MHTEHPRDQPLGAGTIAGTRAATNEPKSTHHSMWWYGVWLSMLDDALQIIIPYLPASRCAARAQPARRRPPHSPSEGQEYVRREEILQRRARRFKLQVCAQWKTHSVSGISVTI